MTPRALLGLILASLALLAALPASARPMPPAAGYIDVSAAPYHADPSGAKDSTDAIQRAIDDMVAAYRAEAEAPVRHPRFLYFPRGDYHVSRPLSFSRDARYSMRMHLVGEDRDTTRIVLRPASPDFANAAAPRPVISFCDDTWSNIGFMNTVEDLTIEVGPGNPGAIALLIHVNNVGYVRRVTLRSSAPDRAGFAGLHLGRRLSGNTVVKDVSVEGFDYGVFNDDGGEYHVTHLLEHVRLSGQRVAGVLSRRKGLVIRRLESDNIVPALLQDDGSGQVVLVDSVLRGGSASAPAIDNAAGWLIARDVRVEGYASPLREHGVNLPLPSDGLLGEHVSGGVSRLFPDAPATSLRLPVRETPDPAWDEPSAWAIVDPAAQDDDTAAVQTAIDSGSRTVFFGAGEYRLSDTIRVRGRVARLHGNWAPITLRGSLLTESKPLFVFEGGGPDAPPETVIEALDCRVGPQTDRFWYFQHDSSRALVLRDMQILHSPAYRNTGRGDLYIENVFSGSPSTHQNPFSKWIFRDQNVWARQLNPEGSDPHVINDGARVWILCSKLGEKHGPYLVALNGGETELLGGVLNALEESGAHPPDRPAVIVDNSTVSLTLLERATTRQGAPHPVFVREYRAGEKRELRDGDLPRRPAPTLRANALNLFRSAAPRPPSDAPLVRLETVPGRARADEQGSRPALLRVARNGSLDHALVVHLDWSGQAGAEDFAPPARSVTIAAGQDSADWTLVPIDDSAKEPLETLSVWPTGGPDYRVAPDRSLATLSIRDNEVDLADALVARYRFTSSPPRDDSPAGNHPLNLRARVGGDARRGWLECDGKGEQLRLADQVTFPTQTPPGSNPADHRKARARAEGGFMHRGFSARTVALRVAPADLQSPQALFEQGAATTGLTLWIENGAIHAAASSEGRRSPPLFASLPGKGPVHVALVFDHGRLAIVLDGLEVASVEAGFASFATSRSPAGLGCTLGGDASGKKLGSFRGRLADFTVHERALIPAELSALASPAAFAPQP